MLTWTSDYHILINSSKWTFKPNVIKSPSGIPEAWQLTIAEVAEYFTCKWILLLIACRGKGLFLDGLRLAVSTVTPGHSFPRRWNRSRAAHIQKKNQKKNQRLSLLSKLCAPSIDLKVLTAWDAFWILCGNLTKGWNNFKDTYRPWFFFCQTSSTSVQEVQMAEYTAFKQRLGQ